MIFSREPAVIIGAVQAIIALAVIFGLPLPAGADAAIIAVVVALGALITRSQVTPVSGIPVRGE